MRSLSTALVLVCCATLAAGAELEVTHDRASGDTTIKTKVRGATATPHLSLSAFLPASPQESPTVALLRSASFGSWHYQECHSTVWLVDKHPLDLPQPSHEGRTGEGFVAEFLTIRPLYLEQMRQMAQAHKIEYTICHDAFTARPEELQDFRTFVDTVKETRGK